MTIVVGYHPAKNGRATLELAALLARSGRAEPLAVTTVTPQHWTHSSTFKAGAEFAEWARRQGDAALDQARQYLADKAPDVPATFHQVAGRSAPAALADACDQEGGDLLVLGSAQDSRAGQVALGSTSEPLLHSSRFPVAIAPRGYRSHCAALTRLSCSFSGADSSHELLTAVAELSQRVGGALRIVTFGVRGRTMFPPEVGLHAEDMVLSQWSEQIRVEQKDALRELGADGLLPSSAQAVIATGSDWADAMNDIEWIHGEVLVVGSSALGSLARVFIGSRATKIIRSSPVPVLVVPGATTDRLADDLGAPEIDPA